MSSVSSGRSSATSLEEQHFPGGDAHFQSWEERVRASSRAVARSGRMSPAHSAHGHLLRASLLRQQVEHKARKVRFYRNGDRFYAGLVFAVSEERYKCWAALLADLTLSPVCDKNVMPNGVRQVFGMSGKRIHCIDDLEDHESYVCSSVNVFRAVAYPLESATTWHGTNRTPNSSPLPLRRRDAVPPEDDRDYVKPKLITVIQNGSRPRRAIRVLLNKKTAHSFEQVLNDFNESLQMTTPVRKVFTISGKQINSLQDFFDDDNVFLAYGYEKHSTDDFDLSNNEIKFVGGYSRNGRASEKVSLKSPKPTRKFAYNAIASRIDSGMKNKAPLPPRSSRKFTNGVNHDNHALDKEPEEPADNLLSPRRTGRGQQGTGTGTVTGNVTGNVRSRKIAAPPAELTERYKIGEEIGRGNFAVVKKCSDRKTKKVYALKIIDKRRWKGKEQLLSGELAILRKIQHRNVTQLVDDVNTADTLFLVLELVLGGDLFDAVSSASKYTERDAAAMVADLAEALVYLHGLRIVHRDVKPENLLIYEIGEDQKILKLGDFGLATEVSEPLRVVCGTPSYVAPEMLAECGYGVQIDVWSAGVLVYVLLCGYPPFSSSKNSQDELFDQIMRADYEFHDPYWTEISQLAKELVRGMLTLDPEQRLTSRQVLSHPWLKVGSASASSDLQLSVSCNLDQNFDGLQLQDRKNALQPNGPKAEGPCGGGGGGGGGLRLMVRTALDNGSSRFFCGRGQIAMQIHQKQQQSDEIF